MKPPRALFLAFALLSAGCVTKDEFRYPNGLIAARLEGDWTKPDITMPQGIHIKADQILHSTTTLASGHATAKVTQSFFAGLSEAFLAWFSGGATAGATAAVSKLGAIVGPVSSNLTGNTPPAVPSALKAH